MGVVTPDRYLSQKVNILSFFSFDLAISSLDLSVDLIVAILGNAICDHDNDAIFA